MKTTTYTAGKKGVNMVYLITFYFIALDFFTGLFKAFATDSLSSKIMRRESEVKT